MISELSEAESFIRDMSGTLPVSPTKRLEFLLEIGIDLKDVKRYETAPSEHFLAQVLEAANASNRLESVSSKIAVLADSALPPLPKTQSFRVGILEQEAQGLMVKIESLDPEARSEAYRLIIARLQRGLDELE